MSPQHYLRDRSDLVRLNRLNTELLVFASPRLAIGVEDNGRSIRFPPALDVKSQVRSWVVNPAHEDDVSCQFSVLLRFKKIHSLDEARIIRVAVDYPACFVRVAPYNFFVCEGRAVDA